MSIWVRVATSPLNFKATRDVIDDHLARETKCSTTWTPIEVPVAYSRPIAARWVKRWHEQPRVLDAFNAHFASVERLERALNGVARGIGTHLVAEYRRGNDMLFVIDVSR